MENDWRLNGQEEYLYGVSLKHINYIHFGINDHDHCEFCWDKFSDRESDCIKVIALRISIYGFVKSVITIFMKCLIGK